MKKREIAIRTLKARARRFYEKQGKVMSFHHPHHRDYLMNGDLYAMIVDPQTNSVESYTDYAGFLRWMREDGLLRPDEEVAE